MFNTSLEFASMIPVVLIQLNIVLEYKIIKPTENDLICASSETSLKPILQLSQNDNCCSWNLAGNQLDNLEYRLVRFLGA